MSRDARVGYSRGLAGADFTPADRKTRRKRRRTGRGPAGPSERARRRAERRAAG